MALPNLREAAYRVLEQRKELDADASLQWLPAEQGALSGCDDRVRYQRDYHINVHIH